MAVLYYVIAAAALLLAYLWRCNAAINTTHPEAAKHASKPWTKDQVQEAYEKAQKSPIDVRPHLGEKQTRRYVVTGGSGLSGGWIVQHLLMRGEDPKAIRILDLVPNTRPEVVKAGVAFIKTDVSDSSAVAAAFDAPWPGNVSKLPLTVFHTVALINPADRRKEFLKPLIKVNIEGTRNILSAANKAGCSCFVATSSGSVGNAVPNYFPPPWQSYGDGIYHYSENGDPANGYDAPLEKFPIAYTWSKAQGEILVREASTPGCPTGIIRPTMGVYGPNIESSASLVWDYFRRGGGPSWLHQVVQNFVCAQNVSIGHLLLEKALLEKKPGVAGSSYSITDPNPPIRYGDLYGAMEQLAHPLTPCKFTPVPFMPMYMISLFVEQYKLFRYHYLPSLPDVTGELKYLQPGMFKVCTSHMVYRQTRAINELGYKGAFTTLDGIADHALDWNRRVEAKAKAKGEEAAEKMQDPTSVPKPPAAR